MERKTFRRNIFGMLLALGLSSSEIDKTRQTGVIPEFLRESIYYSVFPFVYNKDSYGGGYDSIFSWWKIKKKYSELQTSYMTREHYALNNIQTEKHKRSTKNRLDAWRIYLGLPQLYNTFGISLYKPEKSFKDVKYLRIKNYLQNILNDELRIDDRYSFPPKNEADIINFFYNKIFDDRNKDKSKKFFIYKDEENGVMNKYKISYGEDDRGCYISYYDRWDLKGDPIEGVNGTFGTPFEIYDRIYFDPKTFEPINVNL